VVYLEKKKVKGLTYWYAVKKVRINGKLKKAWQLYLGPAKKIVECMKKSEQLPSTKLKSFRYGKTAALFDVNRDLGFVNIVDRYAKKKRVHGLTVGEYILLLIMGRCDKPISKNAMAKWFSKSCMSLLWRFRHKLSCQNFLNHMERLDKVRISIENDIARVLIEKGLVPSTLLLDTSNFYTYIEHGEKLPKKGRSKHHRNDKNLVALGLVVSEDNIPFLHDVYEANNHDGKQFPEIFGNLVKRLTSPYINTKDIVLVCDKGNNSEPNISKVVNEMHIVGSVTHEQAKDLAYVPLNNYSSLYITRKGHKVKGYRTKRKLFGMEFTVVVSYNEHTYRKQSKKYYKDKQKIFDKLKDLNRRLSSKKGKGRSRSSVEREINDIIRKDMRSVIGYGIKEKNSRFRVTYMTERKAEKERRARFGKTVVFTDMHHWHSTKIVKTYNSKYLVEDDFKWFNDTALISIMPIFSRLDKSIRVHVFLCVMGMLFYRYLLWKLRRFKLSGQRIIEELEGIRICVVKQNGTGKGKLVFEEMTPLQARLFSFLDLGKFIDT
jgi:transposase